MGFTKKNASLGVLTGFLAGLLAGAGPISPVPTPSAAKIAKTQIAELGEISARTDLAEVATIQVPRPKPTSQPPAGFVPAPMPDQDADGPAPPPPSSDPSLDPRLLSPKIIVQGEGYAYSSSEPAGIENRRQPAAGFSWDVPVHY